ncbi:MAG: hypothetical protein ACRCV7_05570 [Culicoidibacterales bacterium]
MKKHEFTKKVEKLIDPIEVGTIHFMQSYMKYIPLKFQNKMMRHGAKKSPHMGFVVEPYSFFLCYEVNDVSIANQMLPDGYRMTRVKIFAEDAEEKYYCIFGCFNVHTSAFLGSRMECSFIAENKKTGLVSWVIVDYDTNTVCFDEQHGLRAGNTDHCIITTDYNGTVIVDIKGTRELQLSSDITNGNIRNLDACLWLEGNFSVTYGRELSNNQDTSFAVIFNPKEVEKALDIPIENVCIDTNNWYSDIIDFKPCYAVCFPYAQHFLADSPGYSSSIKNADELLDIVEKMNLKSVPKYSSQSLKKAMQFGQIISLFVILLLLFLLVIK